MHFFYMDESGDTGKNLADPDQPIMVLAGIALRDKSWNTTQQAVQSLFSEFFGGKIPVAFEFHACEALSPNGGGVFAGRSFAERAKLAEDALRLLGTQKHGTFYTAVHKSRMKATLLGKVVEYNPKRPYPVAFDANLSAINQHVKKRLGRSARGMLFFDEKEKHHEDVRKLMRARRFEVAQAHRVKWIVEFGHPLDSRGNPMIQLADLVAYVTRGFLELEHGCGLPKSAEDTALLASCYRLIEDRLLWKQPVPRGEKSHAKLGPYVATVAVRPKPGWQLRYGA